MANSIAKVGEQTQVGSSPRGHEAASISWIVAVDLLLLAAVFGDSKQLERGFTSGGRREFAGLLWHAG